LEILPSHHYQFSALLTSIASLSLVVLVYKKGVRKELRDKFSLYYFALFAWSFSVFLTTSIYNYELSYFFCQTTHIAAIFIPVFFLHFTYAYLDRDKSRIAQVILWIFYLLAVFFFVVVIFFRALFFDGISPKLSFPYFPNAGIFYTPWVISFAAAVFIAHLALFHALLQSSGLKKKQIRFFFIANLIGYFGGIGCFLPVYDLSMFPFPYGPYGVLLLSFVSGYAVLKHRLIDLKILIKRTIVFAFLFGAIMAIFSFVVFVFQNLLSKYMAANPFFSAAIAVVLIIVIYDNVRNFLIQMTDKFLFQKKLDYRVLLKEASEYLAHVDSLKQQSRLIVAFLIKKARIANASVFVFSGIDQQLRLRASRPIVLDSSLKVIRLTHPLIQYFYKVRAPVDLTLLRLAFEHEEVGSKKMELKEIIQLASLFKAEAAIPCFGGEAAEDVRKKEPHLRGFLFLGHQKSDEPYTKEDLDVFFTLAQESSIAFENARLYDEAVERRKALEKTNEELVKVQNQLIHALKEEEDARRQAQEARTATEEMNRELSETNEKLRTTQASLIVAEKNATMVGMAKAIGHEVNNPLTVVRLWTSKIFSTHLKKCYALLDKIPPDTPNGDLNKLKKILTDIENDSKRVHRGADRINDAVHTLTNILKDSKGKMTRLSLTVLVREGIEASRFSTYEENLSTCEIIEKIVPNVVIMGNQDQLLQVFVNLIKNAFEAMGNQKERRIEIRGDFDPNDPKLARLEFSDNGPGIPEGIRAEIWKQDFSTKTKKSDTIGAAGQGQGLFICKHIVESIHKGEITLESEAEKGTTFILKLPLADDRHDKPSGS